MENEANAEAKVDYPALFKSSDKPELLKQKFLLCSNWKESDLYLIWDALVAASSDAVELVKAEWANVEAVVAEVRMKAHNVPQE